MRPEGVESCAGRAEGRLIKQLNVTVIIKIPVIHRDVRILNHLMFITISSDVTREANISLRMKPDMASSEHVRS